MARCTRNPTATSLPTSLSLAVPHPSLLLLYLPVKRDCERSPHFEGKFRPLHVGDTFTAKAGLLSVEFRVEEIRVSGGGERDDDGEGGEEAQYCVVTDETVIDCEGKATAARTGWWCASSRRQLALQKVEQQLTQIQKQQMVLCLDGH